jgi:hypothetical protein
MEEPGMESNLRPRTLGEILDRTAELYRSNFLLFAGIFAVYAGVGLAMNLLLIGLGELLKALHLAASLAWLTLTASAVELLVIFLLFGAAVAAISRAVAWVHLGEPATIRGAYKSILPRLPRYLWLMTITAFVVWTPGQSHERGSVLADAASGLILVRRSEKGCAVSRRLRWRQQAGCDWRMYLCRLRILGSQPRSSTIWWSCWW